MAKTPEPEIHIDFRAPPPSPVASGRRSSVANCEILTDFLEHSLRVPDLILPDRVFPRQKSVRNPPRLDFRSMNSCPPHDDAIDRAMESIAQIGCFQVVNHGISGELIGSVASAGAGMFQIPREKKKEAERSPERPYGFEESHGEEEKETNEEFVWCRNEELKSAMMRICPLEYSNFSNRMEKLATEIDRIAETILFLLQQRLKRHDHHPTSENATTDEINGNTDNSHDDKRPAAAISAAGGGTICYLYKQHGGRTVNSPAGVDDEWLSSCREDGYSLRYDVIRMLIRGSEFSYSLCLYLCDHDGSGSEFHVYSKKGWVSFSPEKDSIVVTVGDQLQTWSGGQCRHVIGRQIFKADKDCMSTAFLYSPPPNVTGPAAQFEKETTVSLSHQLLIVIFLTLLYRLFTYVFIKC